MFCFTRKGHNSLGKNTQGFTLIELFLTIAILAVIAAIGVPSFQETVRSNRITSSSNDIVHSLNYARMEAIRRGASITLKTTSGTNDWSNGYSVESPSEVLKKVNIDHATLQIATVNLSEITFKADGFLSANGEVFTVCSASGDKGRQITLLKSGRIALDEDHPCSSDS
ncbi:MAG: GspH/FimT family pseudopilin [Pseudomonadota bacterium]